MVHGWRALWAGQKVIARIPPGVLMHLNLDDLIQREIFFTGAYEPEVVKFLSEYLKPGMCFIDIGANVGQFTLIGASLVGPKGHVHAFEPSRITYEALGENIRLNGFGQVTTRRIALSDRIGEANFFAEEQENWGKSSLAAFETTDGTTTTLTKPQVVPLTTLDAYTGTSDVKRINLIKMDAEGAELSILKGARHILATCPPPYILCELNFVTCRRFGYHPREIVTLLENRGYQAYHIDRNRTPLGPLDEADLGEHVDALFVLS